MKIIGFGMDNEDGHKRITLAEAFHLYSGSEGSHDEMQALCLLLEEELKARGIRLADASRQDVESILKQIEE